MREGKASSEKAKAERIASGEMLVVSPDKELGRRFQPPFLGDDSGFREWSRKEAQPILDQHPANINMPALLLADTRNTCMAAYLKYDDDRLYERAVEAENLIKERARMAATTKKQAKQAEAYVATIIATVAVAPAIALASMYGKKVR